MATIIINGQSVEAMVTVGCDQYGNGGTPLPEPSTYEGLTADIVDTKTNANGRIIAAVVCSDVAKVTMSWNFLTVSEWSALLATFNSALGGSFMNYVKFFNQTTGAWIVREMYPSDRKAGAFKREAGTVMGWKNCSVNLIDTRNRDIV